MVTHLKWIAALILIAAAFLTGLQTGKEQGQAKWNAEKLVMAEAELKASEEHRAWEAAIEKQLQEALNDVEKWKDQASTSARLRDRDVRRLRDQLANNERRLSEVSEQARIELYRATNAVLGACVEEYSGMADDADRCVAEVIRLNRSWPSGQ